MASGQDQFDCQAANAVPRMRIAGTLAGRLRRRLACRRIFNTGEEAADAAAAGDDGGVSVATDGSAARNDHGPRRAGIPAGALRQPLREWRHLLQRSTKRSREIFAYVLHKNTNRTITRRWTFRQ